MAGSDARFNSSFFRTQIRNTMMMGQPNAVSDRATFRWKIEKTYAGATDPKGKPYDWGEAPLTETDHPDVQVPVAVEDSSGSLIRSAHTPAGEENDRARVVLTVLDVDYEEIKDASWVILGGNTYRIDFWGPPMALFDVDVYHGFASALDES
jgi:hypothetical protein